MQLRQHPPTFNPVERTNNLRNKGVHVCTYIIESLRSCKKKRRSLRARIIHSWLVQLTYKTVFVSLWSRKDSINRTRSEQAFMRSHKGLIAGDKANWYCDPFILLRLLLLSIRASVLQDDHLRKLRDHARTWGCLLQITWSTSR